MGRNPPIIELGKEPPEIALIRQCVGKAVPLRTKYWRGEKPILLSIENDRCTLRFPNDVLMLNVPIEDLIDDSAYWR